jgi:outer membrane protein TolC
VRVVGHEDGVDSADATFPPPQIADDLQLLVATALASNPRLHRMQQEAAAAWERVRYVDELPDPEVGAMALIPPMHYADGRQVASVQFSQRIPWLKRLGAQEQEACFEAGALDASWQAERLRTISEVEVAYYRLYVVEQQLRINRDNRQLIELLVNVATERVAAQAATEGDVLIGTLELSRLEEERYGLEERRASLQANLNRLLNRPAETPVRVPANLQLPSPDWTLDELRQTAWQHQPDIAAAQLRSSAASWGIRVAELERRPEITLNLDWMVMAPREEPGMPAFGGDDTVQVGAMVSVPLWHEKYDAMRDEAIREQMARTFSLYDVQRQYEAALAELLEQARAGARTAELYNSTMLPQARQTFEADRRAYVGPGTVDFDRVVEDFRTVLTLEEGYHRAMGDWAIALARIEQAVARDISSLPTLPELVPAAEPDPGSNPSNEELDRPTEIQLMTAESEQSIAERPMTERRPNQASNVPTATDNSSRFSSRCGASAARGAARSSR